MPKESHKKTLVKTISWRIMASVITVSIAYIIFGSISGALTIGGAEFFAKMIAYYFHERIWQKGEQDG